MAVKIRLRRMGAKKNPLVPHRGGGFPLPPGTAASLRRSATTTPWRSPALVKVDPEKAKKWIQNGAQPTDTVKALFKKHGVL